MANKPNWIDLKREDESHSLRDWFVQATILAGANSVQKLMAVTYLSQFEDLEGEFATNPVFAPDFQIGTVPCSSALLGIYNDVIYCGGISSNGDGQNLAVMTATNTPANIEQLIVEGAQLSRLYLQNKENLERFDDDDSGLFRRVHECYRRDQNLVKNLAYLTDSLIARPEE